jgi:hypothetical protein
MDILTLTGCTSSSNRPNIIVGVDRQGNGATLWWNGTGYETDPTLVPYSMNVRIFNTFVEYIGWIGFGYTSNPRPLFAQSVIGRFDNIF